MSERLDIMNLTQLVERPPTKSYRDGRGGTVVEECTEIGLVDAPADRRRYLEDLGIDLTWAEHDPFTERWERCLFSEGVADLLEDLHAAGDFPYAFESGPSRGGLAWLKAKARGETERPRVPLNAYLIAANAEELDLLLDRDIGRKMRRRK